MKTILFLLTISSLVLSQEYEKAKIDMHGGKFDNYNSIGGYKGGGFRSAPTNLTSFLDKNSTKNIQKKR